MIDAARAAAAARQCLSTKKDISLKSVEIEVYARGWQDRASGPDRLRTRRAPRR
jgi:hypothetical protein